MALEVAAIVKNAGHLDHAIFAAAIKKKMAGLLRRCAAHPAPAEFQVIRPRALDHDLGPFFRAWPLGVGSDIEQRLPDEGTVAQRRGLSEFLEAPFHDGGYVAAGEAGNVKSKTALLSHASVRRRVRRIPLRESDPGKRRDLPLNSGSRNRRGRVDRSLPWRRLRDPEFRGRSRRF